MRRSAFWVDVRLREIYSRWIASDGPSLGLGKEAIEAVEQAPEPFEGIRSYRSYGSRTTEVHSDE